MIFYATDDARYRAVYEHTSVLLSLYCLIARFFRVCFYRVKSMFVLSLFIGFLKLLFILFTKIYIP